MYKVIETVDIYEIVYYQWKGFLSIEKLNEGFRIDFIYTVIVRYDSYDTNYSLGLVAGFDDFFR